MLERGGPTPPRGGPAHARAGPARLLAGRLTAGGRGIPGRDTRRGRAGRPRGGPRGEGTRRGPRLGRCRGVAPRCPPCRPGPLAHRAVHAAPDRLRPLDDVLPPAGAQLVHPCRAGAGRARGGALAHSRSGAAPLGASGGARRGIRGPPRHTIGPAWAAGVVPGRGSPTAVRAAGRRDPPGRRRCADDVRVGPARPRPGSRGGGGHCPARAGRLRLPRARRRPLAARAPPREVAGAVLDRVGHLG